jgi:peptidoglycan hydrolase-like protein with peptidoglycan-binding domain
MTSSTYAPSRVPDSTGLPHWLRQLSWCRLSSGALVRMVSVVLSLFILSMASSAMANLQRGSQGEEVRNLQNQLKVMGCYEGPINGTFASLTQAGVIACQKRLNLEADGVVGPKTMAALYGEMLPEVSPTIAVGSDLKQGSQGQEVVVLQQRLAELGFYQIAIDGDFGRGTEAALRNFQRQNGLADTGMYSAGDRAVIASQPLPMPAVSTVAQLNVGDSGTEVQRLQEALGSRGVFGAKATGFYGPLTRNAVASFQSSQRLPVTGQADSATMAALGFGAVAQQVPGAPAKVAAVSSGVWGDRAFPDAPVTANNGNRFDNVDWSQYGIPNPGQATGQYVVIVPKQNGLTLGQVRQVFSGAFEGKSSLGSYYQVGAFSQAGDADRQSKVLQARGLDARVAYR